MSRLKEALDLMLNQGWCADHCALDVEGEEVSSLSLDAASWCALGAVYKANAGNEEAYSADVTLLEQALTSHQRWYGGTSGHNDALHRNGDREALKAWFERAMSIDLT